MVSGTRESERPHTYFCVSRLNIEETDDDRCLDMVRESVGAVGGGVRRTRD